MWYQANSEKAKARQFHHQRAVNRKPDYRPALKPLIKSSGNAIMAQSDVNFNTIAARALAQSETLLQSWLPDGKLQGREYVVRNPTRQDDRPGSFKINVDTGLWLDGATGDQGGDLISLYAYLNRFDSQYEAAKALGESLGIVTTESVTTKKKADDGFRQVVDGIPDHAPPLATTRHNQTPTGSWAYHNANGRVLGYVLRFDKPLQPDELKPKKDFFPLTLWMNGDRFEWRYKALSTPRPLFNLHLLARNPQSKVVMCEGEACCVAAGELLQDYIPTCNSGGSHGVASADLTPLRGRDVLAWPDADEAGEKWLQSVLVALKKLGCTIAVVNTSGLDSSIGYDAKNALHDGWAAADVEKRIELRADNTKSEESNDELELSSLVKYDHNGKPSLVENSIAAEILYVAKFESLLYLDPLVKEWYRYQRSGIFKICPEMVIQQVIYTAIKEQTRNQIGFSSSYVHGVYSCLKLEAVRDNNNQMLQSTGLICFKNGVLDLKTRTLLPHSPEYFFTNQLPFDWMPDAEYPQLVVDWMYDATGRQLDQVELLRAWFYAVIVGRADLQRLLEVIGFGGSGKGTLLRLLCSIIGHDTVHSTKIEHLENNRFETAKIFNKKLVVVTDAEKWGGDVSTLKAITGQDLIRFEEKNRQSGDSFIYGGMVMILANQHTASNDYSSGIQRRKITLKFDHVVAAEKRRDLDSEFEPLLPNVIKWVLDMPESDVTDYLRSTSSKVSSLRDTRLENLESTNPVIGWMSASVVFIKGAISQIGAKEKLSITTGNGDGVKQTRTAYKYQDERLYPNYCYWCDTTGKHPIGLNNFARIVVDAGNNLLGHKFIKNYRQSGTGKSVIEGVALRGPCEGLCEPYVIDCEDCEDCEGSGKVSDIGTGNDDPIFDPVDQFSPNLAGSGDRAHRAHSLHNQDVSAHSVLTSSSHVRTLDPLTSFDGRDVEEF